MASPYRLAQEVRRTEQKRNKAQDIEASTRVKLRKARTSRLIANGSMLEKVGLDEPKVPREAKLEQRMVTADSEEERKAAFEELSELRRLARYGALLTLREGARDERVVDRWIASARAAEQQEAAEAAKHREALQIMYPLSRTELKTKHPMTLVALAAAGFEYHSFFDRWLSESADPEVAVSLAAAHKGQVLRQDGTPYAPALAEAAE